MGSKREGQPAVAIVELRITWKLDERSCSACSARTLNKSSSLMHAIFKISAAPLLMLRGSSERKNDLHNMLTQEVADCHTKPQTSWEHALLLPNYGQM